jgi:fatty-acid peroxygenase
VDLPEPRAITRGRQLATIVDGFGRPGPPMLRAAAARARLQLWARSLIVQTRRGQLHSAPGSALQLAASATDARARPLPARTAATEFLNIVRPTVAVAWFVVFAAYSLAEHPEWRERIAAGDAAATTAFAQEVRRTTPFAPALAARAPQQQDVLGCPLGKGGYVVLDVFGTLHDADSWPDPGRFDPSRFERSFDADALVPQGGGDTATGHRCPGEPLAMTLLEQALSMLARRPECLPTKPAQVNLRQMPPRP